MVVDPLILMTAVVKIITVWKPRAGDSASRYGPSEVDTSGWPRRIRRSELTGDVMEFEIRVCGELPQSVLDELGGVRVVAQSFETVLQGPGPTRLLDRHHQPVAGPWHRTRGSGDSASGCIFQCLAPRLQPGVMVSSYEIRVVGAIGPLVASTFRGFTWSKGEIARLLTGTADDPENLLAVIDILNANGFFPIDTVINSGIIVGESERHPT